MGFNVAGLIIRKKIDQSGIETLLDNKISFTEEVDFEEATSMEKEDSAIDILQNESGTLLLTTLGSMFDLSDTSDDIIQFMLSEISDTYYFEHYNNGQLIRKFIYSQGEIAEDTGEGIVSEDDDLADKVWELAGSYLQNDFAENMFDHRFKRYELA
ncbi:hypothetical protein [Chitinophaga arvensicola]|uniref:Uncharacterized protein n=1 Tax=Chitinophaga arvensicola TaxID=29529 RepID=A0A1I0SA26_9BACT|nr:hypothetical protein [Chitinophaga arvensicola]SEW53172.1 hypothetical protein SAMN04488122_5361 [Chitinophaga arvensicola]